MSKGIDNIALMSSAGAGKTRELTKRFLRLYLHDAYTLDSLYAITFTNQAAFEMKTRILHYLDILTEQTATDASEQDIIDYFGSLFPDIQKRARSKKTYLLNNLAELHVSTFHSLFASFLSSIPFAAGILPGYIVIDDVREQLLYEEVLDVYFENVFRDKASLKAINDLLEQTETTPKYHVKQIYQSIMPWLGFLRALSTEGSATSAVTRSVNKFTRALRTMKQFVRRSSTAGHTKSGSLNSNLQKVLDAIDNYETSRDCATLEESAYGRAILDGSIATKKYIRDFAQKCGAKSETFTKIMSDLQRSAREYIQALSDKEILLHLTSILHIHAQFAKEKQRQNVISFDDIETYTLHALRNTPETDYLYFRIGTEIKHLMIDEFQDTSHRQLDIIDPLIAEITSVAPREKSIFYVGDPKQAIFRWRGGTSELFDVLLQRYHGKIKKKELVVNYRSKKEIIDFVNHVLEKSDEPKPENSGGWIRVEMCGDYSDVESGNEAIMERTASLVQELHDVYGYAYADIAILVRGNRFGAAMADHLTKQNVPCVSGSRADLMSDCDVRFIFNLLKFLDNPEDDFALMHVLLSPFFDMKEETVRRLKGARRTLYLSLSDMHPEWHVTQKLTSLLARVQFLNPYELIFAVYRELRMKLSYSLATLLDVALEYTQTGEGQLTSFIAWLEQAGPSIEIRAADTEGVRVLTVHKAKGLEFEVVIVPETNSPLIPFENRQLLFSYKDGAIPDRIYWRKYGKHMPGLKRAEHERIRNDGLNLLYVALTRAKTGVHVLGFRHPLRKLGFWFGTICEKVDAEQYSVGDIVKKPLREMAPKEKKYGALREEHPAVQEERELYSPTERGIEILDAQRRKSMEFGLIIHDALSRIIWLDGIEFEKCIDDIVTHVMNKHARTQQHADEMQEKLQIVSELPRDPELRFVFYRDNRNIQCKTEVPIYFEKEKKDVSGYIDRLLIEPDTITIIDFKTGEDKSEYKHQMRLYAQGIKKIYPGRSVSTYLIFLERKRGERLVKM